MKNFALATAAVNALDVGSQPDHAQIEKELIDIGEKAKVHLPYALYNLGYAVRSGYSWNTVGEVKLKDVGMVFVNTQWYAA